MNSLQEDYENEIELFGNKTDFLLHELILMRTTHAAIGLCVVISIITNTFVVIIFLSSKYGKITTPKICYANISISDLLFLITSIVQASIFGSGCTNLCRTVMSYMTHISGYISCYTMAVIAIKRYQSIALPLAALGSKHAKRNTIIFLSLIWVLALVLAVVFVKYDKEAPHFTSTTSITFFEQICDIIYTPTKASYTKPYFTLITMVLIPLSIAGFFSLKAIIILRNWNPVGEFTEEQKKIQKSSKKRSIFTIVLVTTFFTISWLPITIFHTLERVWFFSREPCNYNYNLYAIFTFVLMTGFGVNPIIYWYLNPDFRKGVKTICTTCLSKTKFCAKRWK